MSRVKSVWVAVCCLALFSFCLNGCGGLYSASVIDPAAGLTRKDYLALRERGQEPPIPEVSTDTDTEQGETPPKAAPQTTSPAIPEAPTMLAPPPLPPKAARRNVSVSMTEDVPLRDVLIELGREAKIGMAIDPRIEGGLIFSAHDKPFEEVLEKIATLAGLRYRTEGDFVRIELDEPYQKTYPLDYPSLSRRTTSEVSISTNVFDTDAAGATNGSSGSGRSSSSGEGNNSTAHVSSSSEADFWAELEKSLPKLLASARPLASNARQQGAKNEDTKPTFAIDKQAGIVTVYATDYQQRVVGSYFSRLQHKATRQVLIEARIVEVELTDGFQSGVNWQALLDKSGDIAIGMTTGGLAAAAANGVFTANIKGTDFNGILKLVRDFGTTRVLSSPRLTVLNNQTAILKVARNEVYFITQAQYSTTVNGAGVPVSGTPVFTSTPHTVPVGLILAVQPAIDPERDRVTMTLRPTISRVVSYVSDPSIALNAKNAGISQTVDSRVPVLAVREMDSVLQLKSGEVAIMGGLMQDSSENQDQGLPPFDTMPLIGNLAKSRENKGTTSELVILLRATILDAPPPDTADYDLYERYGRDPRPLVEARERE